MTDTKLVEIENFIVYINGENNASILSDLRCIISKRLEIIDIEKQVVLGKARISTELEKETPSE